VYAPATRYDRKDDVRARPGPLRTATTLAVLAALALVALAGLRRSRRAPPEPGAKSADVALAAVIALVLCGALALVAASTPAPRLLSATLGYTLWWGSQAGMWAWLTLAWAACLALAPAARRLRVPRAAPFAAAALGLGATAAVATASAHTAQPDEHVALYRPIASLAGSLERRVPPRRTVLLEGGLDVSAMPAKPALRYFLVRHGDRVLGPGSYRRLGWWYELERRPYDESVDVSDQAERPARRFSLVAEARYRDGWGAHVLTVWLGPGRQ